MRDVWIKIRSSYWCEQNGTRLKRPIGFSILPATLRIELEEKDRQLELKDQLPPATVPTGFRHVLVELFLNSPRLNWCCFHMFFLAAWIMPIIYYCIYVDCLQVAFCTGLGKHNPDLLWFGVCIMVLLQANLSFGPFHRHPCFLSISFFWRACLCGQDTHIQQLMAILHQRGPKKTRRCVFSGRWYLGLVPSLPTHSNEWFYAGPTMYNKVTWKPLFTIKQKYPFASFFYVCFGGFWK